MTIEGRKGEIVRNRGFVLIEPAVVIVRAEPAYKTVDSYGAIAEDGLLAYHDATGGLLFTTVDERSVELGFEVEGWLRQRRNRR